MHKISQSHNYYDLILHDNLQNDNSGECNIHCVLFLISISIEVAICNTVHDVETTWPVLTADSL